MGITLHAPFFPESTVLRAERFCRELGIPHKVLDVSKEFQEQVIDYLIRSYCQGLTPNPCAVCNRSIKFSLLLEKASDQGCSLCATGHYARLAAVKGGPFLESALDRSKSQEYFLALVKKEALSRVILPLGDHRKEQVSGLMQELYPFLRGLSESQEICFIKNNKYREFIRERIPDQSRYQGLIRHVNGTVLGRHEGFFRYTYGQREGLGIAWKEPLYVIDIDPQTSEITVGERSFLFRDEFGVEGLNWFYEPGKYEDLKVRIRYNAPCLPCAYTLKDEHSLVCRFTDKKEFTAPGQVAVFYDRDRIVCAGIIQKAGYSG